ncbi:MAG: UvrD-helicase domain-containing protein, partial [Raoultibacter sp.]
MSSCAQCSHAASSDDTQSLQPTISAYPSATADEASVLDAAYVKIAGAGGTGKTEALIKTALHRMHEGTDPASILFIVNTADAARAVSLRLRAADAAAQSIRVTTMRTLCTEIL